MYFRKGDLKMKKSKLSLCLVTSFIGALALSACSTATSSGPTSSTESIIEGIEYNTETGKFKIDIDKFYKEYGESEEGTTLFYNSVLESLIRNRYEKLSSMSGSTLRPYAALVRDAEKKVEVQHQLARDNASSNGTTESEEWDKILESYKCESENDLKEHFLYELEKPAMEDWFYKTNISTLKDQYIGVKEVEEGGVKSWETMPQAKTEDYTSVFPYHILHVLVKLDADASDYSRAEIKEAEAEKLWNVVRKLIDGSYDFEQVVASESQDTSADEYGDVGIMSTQTSFYNEFKLGIYAYDALLSNTNIENDSNADIYKAFGISKTSLVKTETLVNGSNVVEEQYRKVPEFAKEEMVTDVQTAVNGYVNTPSQTQFLGLPTVPWQVFKLLDDSKSYEKIGSTELDTTAASYPRNILFNQFLNFRSPFVITNEDITAFYTDDDDTTTKTVAEAEVATAPNYTHVSLSEHNFETGDFKVETPNFTKNAVPSMPGKSVLTTNKGDVVIGVRSTAGIHFMVMRKSVFYNTNAGSYEDKALTISKANTSLSDYYTTEVPTAAEAAAHPSYIYNVVTDDNSYYTSRADTIKNKLKNADSSDIFDAGYEYRLFNYLINNVGASNITFFDGTTLAQSKIYQNIVNKYKLLRENKFMSYRESIISSWKDYLLQLENQNAMRELKGQVATTCAFKFMKAQNESDPTAYIALFNEGGACYVK